MKKIINVFLKFKLNFKIPQEKKIVVIDKHKSFYLNKELLKFDCEFLNTRYEEINIYILLLTIKNFRSYKNITFYQKYLLNYIKFLNPAFIINCTTVDIFFLSLKHYFPQVKYIIVQNEFLSEQSLIEILKKKKKISFSLKADYACIFGINSKNFYSKFINVKKYLITGSIKNNYFEPILSQNNKICFISQFRIRNNKILRLYSIKLEKLFFKNLLKYCIINKKKLYVLSSNAQNLQKERDFFDYMLGVKNYKFISKSDWTTCYKTSKKINYFVAYASTLAYELLAKQKRVFFFKMFKIKKIKDFYSSFYIKKSKGFFWSNEIKFNNLKKNLNRVFYSNNKTYKIMRKKLIDPICIYNKNNKVFKKLLNKIN